MPSPGNDTLTPVELVGSGLAATCCAKLIQRSGITCVTRPTNRSKAPTVMLSRPTQNLLIDIFERADLFEGLLPIRERVVTWGPNAKPLTLPHEAVVVSEDELLGRLQLEHPDTTPSGGADENWTIYSARPLPPPAHERHFGSRMATATSVDLLSSSASHTCWVESLDSGWLFLIPNRSEGWLLAVGGSPAELLDQSTCVAPQIGAVHSTAAEFSCQPRIAEPLCGNDWVACGTAAVSFDPICGDGTGNAAREAILACAAIRAIMKGADLHSVLSHYRLRLQAGLIRHLHAVRTFYDSGGSSSWWVEQVKAAENGLDWGRSLSDAVHPPRFRLRGFSLEPAK